MKLTIFIGCFNEKATIFKSIEEAKKINADKEIIIIDNCSTDGTRQILEGLKNDNSLKIILHSENMGAGYSAGEAIQMAQGDYFYGPGADLEYKMTDVYKMVEKLEREDLDAVFGSRLLARGNISKLALIKERPYWLGTIIATFLINLFYGKNFTDVIGINLVKTAILRTLNCKSSSQTFTFELISKLCKNKYRIGEVPLWYKPRTHKEGKTIRAQDMIPALAAMFKIKFLS
ncbi:MAG: glycosyltransferase family 2 protein [Candidatus Omnitrophica bacterium]|nr:glycosyltransferase family 2 protein [Candidatus Omnitrophota bacterium]